MNFFEKRIRPVLAKHCHTCHNPELRTAGLDLTTAEGFKQGGQSGSLVSVGEPQESRLLRVVNHQESVRMPPTGKLLDQEIVDFRTWVQLGAPWPDASETKVAQKAKLSEHQENLWAFQPIREPIVPEVTGHRWIRTPIDHFVLAKLEKKGLRPAASADKLTLLRRATFDLTGLPPTIQEIRRFLADESPDAFENVLDHLLSSPRYGERWGRHWLDVARYADSTGNDEDHRYPYAWRYRDYVIDAFQRDLPYDEFIVEQIAGDLLPKSDHLETNQRRIIATGLLALGPKAIAQQDKTKMLYDVYDEQLDVVSKGVLGLTITLCPLS